MRPLLVFILISLSSLSSVWACGWSPWGEEVRYTQIRDNLFNFPGYYRCYYTYYMYSGDWRGESDDFPTDNDENVHLWSEYANGKVSEVHIYNAIYGDAQDDGSNPFMAYLKKTNQQEAIDYIRFAHSCNIMNTELSDPWERSDVAILPKRERLMNEALRRAEAASDPLIKKRYAFLGVRLAFYNRNTDQIHSVYEKYFAAVKTKDRNMIDYWAMFFKAQVHPDKVYSNYLAAQVFQHSSEKRFSILLFYNFDVPAHQTLAYAKSNEERSAIWLMSAIRSPGRSLESLKGIYALDPSSEGLSFLLLREVSKLEDWIYTPYYTAYDPSLYEDTWKTGRLAKDRAYAQSVLDFLQSVNMKKVSRPEVWNMAKAYLMLMSKRYAESIALIDAVKNEKYYSAAQKEMLLTIRAVAMTANQPAGQAVIPEEVKPVLLRQAKAKNQKFIFAIAKELEFNGNTTDAAFLLAHINKENRNSEDYWNQDNLYWQGRSITSRNRDNYYDEYFDYLDANYDINEIGILITAMEAPKAKDEFSRWFYQAMRDELPRIYELQGTKYLRQNQLANALTYYEKVNDSIWRQDFFKQTLNANTFYTNVYNGHTPNEEDTITFTKKQVVRTLMRYIQYADNPNNKDRDYYYFLVANCYLNMTKNGNSWAMRHYHWTHGNSITKREDDDEYFGALLAKQYYLKAKAVTKSPKFGALCLRMAGRCERYHLEFVMEDRWDYSGPGNYEDVLFSSNNYYKQLRREYPNDYDELISNCEAFRTYFYERKGQVKKQLKPV